ncbi:hypothetical protein BGW38_008740, partial [Lunasporangiospora selenospora]
MTRHIESESTHLLCHSASTDSSATIVSIDSDDSEDSTMSSTTTATTTTTYGTLSTFPRIDLSKPRYDQSTYLGRVRHFIKITSPLNLLVTPHRLEGAKTLIADYNSGRLPPNYDPSKLWRAKE